jgi:hypothetical protein
VIAERATRPCCRSPARHAAQHARRRAWVVGRVVAERTPTVGFTQTV